MAETNISKAGRSQSYKNALSHRDKREAEWKMGNKRELIQSSKKMHVRRRRLENELLKSRVLLSSGGGGGLRTVVGRR